MAKKLSIQIKLEGGKEIKRELAEMGAEGKKAFDEIQKAAKQAGGFDKLDPAKLTQFNTELKKTGVAAAELDKVTAAVDKAAQTERLVRGIKLVETSFATLTSTVKLAALAFGPMGVVIGLVGEKAIAMATSFATAASKIDAGAIAAGMSLQKFEQLRQGFEKAKISADGVGKAMQGVREAAAGSNIDLVTKAWVNLGKASNDAGAAMRARPADLRTLQEAAEGIGPGADKARAAVKLLREATEGSGPAAAKARAEFMKWSSETKALGSAVEPTARTLQDFITKMGGDAVSGTAAFVESLRTMPDSANRSQLAINAFKDAGEELVQSLRSGVITEDQFKERLGGLSQTAANTANTWNQSVNVMDTAFKRFLATGDFSALNEGFSEFHQQMMVSTTATTEQLEKLGGKIGELASAIGGAVWDTFASAGTAAIKLVTDAIDGLIQKFKDAVSWVGKLFSSGGGTPGETTPIPGNASGGLIGGRGTGTSDSNLSWVSRGEHIMPAGAVRQPGVLAFLEALRRSGGDLSRVIDRMGHFATGGLVSMPALAASSGGGMSHVTIAFPGLPAIGGLRASSDVVDELRKAAAMAQVRSGGRKPSRYT